MLDNAQAVTRFTALGNETRLAIYRWLLPFNPEGKTFGDIAQSLGLADATLAFHLRELMQVGLLQSRPDGRKVIYSVQVDNVLQLIKFMTENCCSGNTFNSKTIVNCKSTAVKKLPANNPAIKSTAKRSTSSSIKPSTIRSTKSAKAKLTNSSKAAPAKKLAIKKPR